MMDKILSKRVNINYQGHHYGVWFNYHYSFVQLNNANNVVEPSSTDYEMISLLLSALINFNCYTPTKIFRYMHHTIIDRNKKLFKTSCNTNWGSFIIVNSTDFVGVNDLISVQLLIDWCIEFYGNEPKIIPRSHFKICGESSDE